MKDGIRLQYYSGCVFLRFMSKYHVHRIIGMILTLWFIRSIHVYTECNQYPHDIFIPIILIIIIFIPIIKSTHINRHVYFEIKPNELIFHSYFKNIRIDVNQILNIMFDPYDSLIINAKPTTYYNDNSDGLITIPIPDIVNFTISDNGISESNNYFNNKKEKQEQILNLINYVSNNQFQHEPFEPDNAPNTEIDKNVLFILFTVCLLSLPYLYLSSVYAKHYGEPTYNFLSEEITYNNTQKTNGTINGYKFVDLGLSVVWATENLGAEEPTDSGKYYIWGDIHDISHPQTKENEKKINRKNSIPNNICGIKKWDPARYHMEGRWRMPRKSEIKELFYKCKWYIVTTNKQKYYKVVGPNGNHIIMPATISQLALEKNQKYGHYTHYISGTYEYEHGRRYTFSGFGLWSLDLYLVNPLEKCDASCISPSKHGVSIDQYPSYKNIIGTIRPVANLKPISFTRFLFNPYMWVGEK